jgi:Tol biopolymer transport system component
MLQPPKRPAEKPKEMSFRPLTSYGWDSPIDAPAISPDGRYLAFWMKEKLFRQVVQSGETRALALPEWFNPGGVSWFPDGTKLLLCRVEEGRKPFVDFSLWSMSILGGDPRKVVDHAQLPSISPDGSLIAFDRFDPERRTIWVVGSNGDSPRRVRASPQPNEELFRPVWSPNGQRLFYRRSDDKYHAIESCDLAGENVTTIFSTKNDNSMRWDLCWVADGRLIFPMAEAGPQAGIFNLWEIKVDGVTGAPLSEARRLTQWSGFSFSNVAGLSITADGKQLALLKANAQADIYVAEVEPAGKALKNPRPLTDQLSDDFVWDWTADSRAIFFASDRNGSRDIFKQDIDQTEPETIIASPEHEGHPSLSPDQAFVLYLVSKKRDAPATRLMRVPVSGGPTEPVLTGEKIKNFSCARDAKMCVVVEEMNGKQILTNFDPLKGRGERLPASDYPDFGGGILVLSPQGRLIEKMKPGPAGLYIRVRSLAGGVAEEVTFKDLMGDYGFLGWSLDGKGMYLWNLRSLIFTAFYAGLDGHSQVFWKVGTSPGYSLDHPIPSPDGRHLAFTVMRYEANAWMLENF